MFPIVAQHSVHRVCASCSVGFPTARPGHLPAFPFLPAGGPAAPPTAAQPVQCGGGADADGSSPGRLHTAGPSVNGCRAQLASCIMHHAAAAGWKRGWVDGQPLIWRGAATAVQQVCTAEAFMEWHQSAVLFGAIGSLYHALCVMIGWQSAALQGWIKLWHRVNMLQPLSGCRRRQYTRQVQRSVQVAVQKVCKYTVWRGAHTYTLAWMRRRQQIVSRGGRAQPAVCASAHCRAVDS